MGRWKYTGAKIKWKKEELKSRYLLTDTWSRAVFKGLSKSPTGICNDATKNHMIDYLDRICMSVCVCMYSMCVCVCLCVH